MRFKDLVDVIDSIEPIVFSEYNMSQPEREIRIADAVAIMKFNAEIAEVIEEIEAKEFSARLIGRCNTNLLL